MSKKEVAAIATRVEIDPDNNQVYLVFKIIDESLKKRVREDWTKDMKFRILGRELIEEE
jgi:hypothetical protein